MSLAPSDHSSYLAVCPIVKFCGKVVGGDRRFISDLRSVASLVHDALPSIISLYRFPIVDGYYLACGVRVIPHLGVLAIPSASLHDNDVEYLVHAWVVFFEG